MSFDQENRQAIRAYFEQGAQKGTPCCKLGVEVEHFIVHDETLQAVSYESTSTAFGVRDVLDYLSSFYPRKMFGLEGDLIGLASDSASLTLEPAAQLEISIAPFSSVRTIAQVYRDFRELIDPFLAQYRCSLVALGYHPTEKALDLPLIPKQRYRFMDEYFHALGTHGERMMRASASTQVSIDYVSEADAIRKMRTAQALVPFIAFLTDNVVRFEGEAPDQPLSRLAMWRDVDPERCGQVPGLFEPSFSFDAYADWLLGACPIFVTRPAADDPQGPQLRAVFGVSAQQAYGDAPMDKDDIEHLLSMFWPDVRLKQFVEIRPADALPQCAIPGYAAFIKGLFYNEKAIEDLECAFGVRDGIWPLTDSSTDEAMAAIRRAGLDAVLYGKTLKSWIPFLFDLAKQSLTDEEIAYLQAFREWTERD